MSVGADEREAERKYLGVDALPDVTDLGSWSAERRFVLRAEYYDTPDYELARSGISLRRRSGGDDEGWHIKLPVAADVRREIRLPLTGERVPARLRAELRDVIGNAPLVPVAVLTTERRQSDLLDRGGEARAHVVRDVVTSVVGPVEDTWHEAEVELAPAEPLETLDALDARLLASGAERAPHGSKVGRALTASIESAMADRGLETPAGDLILRFAGKQIGVLQALEEPVRVDAPDAVHKSRVAARRLRSILRTYGALLDAEFTGPLIDDLRWYGLVAGGPRDAEVLKEHLLAAVAELDAATAGGGVADRLASELDDLHEAARGELLAAMAGERFGDLHRRLTGLLASRPLRDIGYLPAEFILDDLVRAAIARVRRRYARALRHPDQLERWHDVRKAAKAVRYCCEALIASHGAPASAAAKRWESVTEYLGDVQDSVVAYDTLGQLAEHAAATGEPTGTYATLQSRQVAKRREGLLRGQLALDAALAVPLDWLR